MNRLKGLLLSALIALTLASFPLPASSQGRQADTCRFCGVWKAVPGGRWIGRRKAESSDKTGNPYCGCDYLEITKAGVGKFRLRTGADTYNKGKINWWNADGIYLRLIGGKLMGTFISNNFYATQGVDFTFKITCELKDDDGLVFSVSTKGEIEKANYSKGEAQERKATEPLSQALPRLRTGTPYRTVRKELMKLGWQPVTLPSATPCGDDDRCRGFSEVYFCVGTGRAQCIYMWTKKTTLIRIVAWGEGDQRYESVAPCQSLHPTQIDFFTCR